ncbi:hypothetical protein [Sphingomonas crocodyli]|nr:hypothetical protein [Sphingomonas crocodyli]
MDRNGKQTGGESRFAIVRRRVRDGIKWWAEHQAWPATEEVRIEPKKLRF